METITSGKRLADSVKRTDIKPIKLSEIKTSSLNRVSTGLSELDLVLGGGIVPGMAMLLSGEPGIGKSTLLLALANNLGALPAGRQVLYVSGEESASQIKIRAERLEIKSDKIAILEETDVDLLTNQLTNYSSNLVIVDSIQTLTTSDLTGPAGSVGQVRECASRLISATKNSGIPLFLIGHVTKEGAIAGPKVLEHIVDTVLSLEGERNSNLRILRTTKNRFGPTDEVGLFEMSDSGLKTANLPDFENIQPAPGSCLTVTMEGTRPMLVEIQALTTSTPLPSPRRVANGIDYARLQMIVAILQKRLNLPLYKEDVYVNVSGGLKISEPAVDLPVALAILSSFRNKALASKTVAIGELDLLGNIRPVNTLSRRIKEAKKLGYKNILTSENLRSLGEFKMNP